LLKSARERVRSVKRIGTSAEIDDAQTIWTMDDSFAPLFYSQPAATSVSTSLATSPATTSASASTATSTSSVLADVTAHESDGFLGYGGALAVLRDAANSPMNATVFSELTAVADDLASGEISTSRYVKQMFDNVVLGNSANAYWNGGSDDEVALGDLSATSRPWEFKDLIRKWFLGTDMPGVASAPGVTLAPWESGGDTSYQASSLPLFTSAGPQITDVSQGQVGDCWFLAALGETALLDPSLIDDMITEHGNGTYSIRFEVNGRADYVTVNDQLSTYSGGIEQYNGSQMEFANSTTSLWVPLIEKGLAQLSEQTGVQTGMQYGGADDQYYALNSGAGEGMSLITGQSNTAYYLGDESASDLTNLLGTLQSSLAAGNDVLVGTSDDYVSGNLVDDHMFAVTGINATTGMVTLYNPWGSNAYGEGKAETFSIAASALVDDQAWFYAAQGTIKS
jgi:Calpain family cysteine protease